MPVPQALFMVRIFSFHWIGSQDPNHSPSVLHHESQSPALLQLPTPGSPNLQEAPGRTGSSHARGAPALRTHDDHQEPHCSDTAMPNDIVWSLFNTRSSSWAPAAWVSWHLPAPWGLGTVRGWVSWLGLRAMCPLPMPEHLGPGLEPPSYHYIVITVLDTAHW